MKTHEKGGGSRESAKYLDKFLIAKQPEINNKKFAWTSAQ